MSEMSNEAVQSQIVQRGLKVGNSIHVQTSGAAVVGSQQVYADASGQLAVGGLPFVASFLAGVTSTANSVMTIEGSATGSANELMHLTLVSGANATATIAGYYRATVTDDAGVITTGAYYVPFYTLG